MAFLDSSETYPAVIKYLVAPMPSDPEAFRPAPFFVFRTALLPWSAFEEWNAGIETPNLSPHAVGLEESFRRGKEELRKRLQELISQPRIRESLFLASPDLDASLVHWFSSPDSEKGSRVERSLVRYFSRMCGRSTPFGLFAGCSIGRTGDVTRLELAGSGAYLRHTRLDMDYLCALAKALAEDPMLIQELTFRPNSSLYRIGGRMRFAEARLRNKSRGYHLVAVAETPYLLDTLRRAEKGASLRELALPLVDSDITLQEAEAYIHELVDSQLLVAELHPAVTGPEPIHDLIFRLRTLRDGANAARLLEEARDGLSAIDSKPLGVPAEEYKAIAGRLSALPTKVELNRLFQADLVKPAPEAVLGPDVLSEVKRAIHLLHSLFGGGVKDSISAFAESFQARYENQELPLVEVLDDESGIGFDPSQAPDVEASPLLEGLEFPGQAGGSSVPWTPFQSFLLEKLMQAQRNGSLVLRLKENELEPFFQKNLRPLPASLAVMAKIESRNEVALHVGNFKIWVGGVMGPSGANLLGRFCHGDSTLAECVSAFLKEEESITPDAVFAEIVHLPEGRVGNVILRPVLRKYEIPFLGRSGAADDQQIPITDLLVSVRQGRVCLRSGRLGKEVRPRLSSAHNYSFRSLGMYRFLCMLQHHGVAGGLSWNWGAFEAASFLPRVEVGRLVLSKSKWNLTSKEFKTIVDANGIERWRILQEWRTERNIPRLVVLADGDNQLPLDLENVLSVENFIDLVKKRSRFTLEEFFPDSEGLTVEGPEGRFVHELIVPFTNLSESTSTFTARPAPIVRRSFSPGSEWLYIKIYAGKYSVDQLLRAHLGPLVRNLLAEGVADGWFFIRYGDPDWHLRLRLHGNPARLWGEGLRRLQSKWEPLLNQGLAWKVQIDTYQRELERYGGGEAMLLAERLFQADSEAVLSILETYTGDSAADARWRVCLAGMDRMLNDLGFDLREKASILQILRQGAAQGIRATGALDRQLGEKFRKERVILEGLLQETPQCAVSEGISILSQRSLAVKETVNNLRSIDREGKITGGLSSLAGSFLHMHANRILRGSAGAQELVIYDFLCRIYNSRLAQKLKVTSGG